LGSRSLAGGSIYAGGCPSTFAASWPAFTNSLRANLVAVERGHDNGSTMMMGCGGAIRTSGGAQRQSEQGMKANGRAVLRNEGEGSGGDGC
jgi:hypothetical protein